MSCGPSKALNDLADSIDSFTGVFDMSANKAAVQAEISATVGGIIDGLKASIPEIDIPTPVVSLQSDITDFAEKILTAKLAGEDLLSEFETIKSKWEGVDLGNLNINDIPRLIRSGAMDLDNICQLIPNFELDGAEITLRGTPITFPDINVVDIIKGGSLPRLTKPDFTTIINRRVKNGANKFLNISAPGLYEG